MAKLRELDDPDLRASLLAIHQPERDIGPQSLEIGDPAALKTVIFRVGPDAPSDEHDQKAAGDDGQPQFRFRILRPLAEGGLGKVSIAQDKELNREVAFKEIKLKFAQDADARSRFMVEAEVTGRLEHPSIVPVYGLGHFADGRPFYAMRFIRGDSLQATAEAFHKAGATSPYDQDLQFRNLIKRLIDVCNAIAYAHARKVLHRDLKPGNIMLGKYGETLVVDWGLAKAQGVADATGRSVDGEQPIVPTSGSQSAPTMAGAIVGTPAYMSPEQAAGKLEQLGPACDIYSLGATLYQVLTGQAPLKGVPFSKLLKRVTAGDIPSAKSLNPRVPAALDAVCKKAMSRSINDRYATASDLAKDLESWLADKPVSAFPEPLLVRARRWSRQHPALVSSVTAAVLMAAIGLAIGFVVVTGKNTELDDKNIALVRATDEAKQSAIKAQTEERRALAEERKAIAAAADSERQAIEAKRQEAAAKQQETAAKKAAHLASVRLYGSQLADAKRELDLGNHGMARMRLEQTEPVLRGWEFRYLDHLIPHPLKIKGNRLGVRGVSFSPDGSRIICATGAGLKLWNSQTGELIFTFNGHSQPVSSVSYSSDGKRIVSGSYDFSLRVWDAQSGESVKTLKGHTDRVSSVSFSPDGKQIISGSHDKTVKRWDVQTGTPVLTINGHSEQVNCVVFSPDGKRFASASNDKTLKVWDALTGESLMTLKGHKSDIASVSFNSDGTQIVSGGGDNTVKVWDSKSGELLLSLSGQYAPVLCVSFSPDGKQILGGCGDRKLRLWDTKTGMLMLTLNEQSSSVDCASFSPDGRLIASGSAWGTDSILSVWEAQKPESSVELQEELSIKSGMNCIAFSTRGTRIVSGNLDQSLSVWDMQTGRRLQRLNGHSGLVSGVSISPDENRVASIGFDQTLRLWDIQTGESLLSVGGPMYCVAYSPDGTRIVTSNADKTMNVRDAQTGEPLFALQGINSIARSASFSPDGKRVVACKENQVGVWDAVTGESLLTLKGHSKYVFCVAYSLNGQRIVGGGFDNSVMVWDALTGELLQTLTGHPNIVKAVTFSPDGTRIISGSVDNSIRI